MTTAAVAITAAGVASKNLLDHFFLAFYKKCEGRCNMRRGSCLVLFIAIGLIAALCLASCNKIGFKKFSKKFNPNLVLVYWGELMGNIEPCG